jgi:hypothetical protein
MKITSRHILASEILKVFPRIFKLFWLFMVIMTSKICLEKHWLRLLQNHEKRISTLSGQTLHFSKVKKYFIVLKKWLTSFNYTNLMFTQCLLSHCHYKSLLKTLRLFALRVRVIRWYNFKTGEILFRLISYRKLKVP